MSLNRSKLGQLIRQYFSYNDLSGLVFDNFYEHYDDVTIPGLTLDQRIRGLLEYCSTRNQMMDLLNAIQQERPFLSNPIQVMRSELENEVSLSQTPPQHVQNRTASRTQRQNAPIMHDPKKIFISHAIEDKELALYLANKLKGEGYDYWLSYNNIRPGEKWISAITRGLEVCGKFFLLMTPAAFQSEGVAKELDIALLLEYEKKMQILTLLMMACDVPTQFRTRQYINFAENYASGWNSLRQALKSG